MIPAPLVLLCTVAFWPWLVAAAWMVEANKAMEARP
jgi:hypothetical protein